jgi:hypothetical protein
MRLLYLEVMFVAEANVVSQVVAVIIFGAIVILLPAFLNRFADSRSQPR